MNNNILQDIHRQLPVWRQKGLLWINYIDYAMLRTDNASNAAIEAIDPIYNQERGGYKQTPGDEITIGTWKLYFKYPKELVSAILAFIGRLIKYSIFYVLFSLFWFLSGSITITFMATMFRKMQLEGPKLALPSDGYYFIGSFICFVLFVFFAFSGLALLIRKLRTVTLWCPPVVVLWEKRGTRMIPHVYRASLKLLMVQYNPEMSRYKNFTWEQKVVFIGAPLVDLGAINADDMSLNDEPFMNTYRQAVMAINNGQENRSRSMKAKKHFNHTDMYKKMVNKSRNCSEN